jgi:hypothetical protein
MATTEDTNTARAYRGGLIGYDYRKDTLKKDNRNETDVSQDIGGWHEKKNPEGPSDGI